MSNQTVNIVELKKVVEAVRSAPEDQFDMRHWFCGTSRCAIGWYVKNNPESPLIMVRLERTAHELCPVLGRQIGFDALAEFFAISSRESYALFYPKEGDSRAAVIARIEKFIAEHEKAAGAK